MNSQLTVIRNYLEIIIVDYWHHMVNTYSDQQFVGGGGGKRKSYGFFFARFPNVMKRS